MNLATKFLPILLAFTFDLVSCQPFKNYCDETSEGRKLEITDTNIDSTILVDSFKRCQYVKIIATNTGLQDINTPRGTFGKIHHHHLQNLTLLDLSFNKLVSLRAAIFSGANQLQHLNLSHNVINTINVAAFINLTKLEVIDLSYNSLKTLYWQSINFTLKGLYLSHNKHLTHIQKITPMATLETLHLAHTSLANINCFSQMHNLMDLDLSHNSNFKINTFTFLYHMQHLKCLRLAAVKQMVYQNRIKNKAYLINIINFPRLEALETLDISGNGLQKIARHVLIKDKFPNLQELMLYDNKFYESFRVDFAETIKSWKSNYTFKVICKLNSTDCPLKKTDSSVIHLS